ncbi:replication-relaxation family protein [Nocardia heshunensis]
MARQPRQAVIASRRGPSIADALAEQRQLTPRDLELLALLAAHKAFTAGQVTRLFYPANGNAARKRLALLERRGVLARFRACPRPGSQEYRYTLGPIGAMIRAAATDRPIPTPHTVYQKAFKLSQNPQLDHLLGINEFFTALRHYSRGNSECTLREWWNERDATQSCSAIARPDGYGEWEENGNSIRFFLEYDTGTETLSRLVDKLQGYRELRDGGIAIPVLFVLPGPKRQRYFHQLLDRQPAALAGLTVATTTVADLATDNPAAPVWWLAGHTARLRLATLPAPPAATHAA